MKLHLAITVLLIITCYSIGWWAGGKLHLLLKSPSPQAKMSLVHNTKVKNIKYTGLNGTDFLVAFTPSYGGLDPLDVITQTVASAKHNIMVQCYQFTSQSIANALVLARKRGVDVFVIADPSGMTPLLESCQRNGRISVLVDRKHHISHNKVMVIDGETVITGSYNYSDSAEKSNAENIFVFVNKECANAYTENWAKHQEHSGSK